MGVREVSIAQQVTEGLRAREGVLVVFAEPWAFDPNTDPKAHLIGDVLNAISERVDEAGSDFRQRLKGLLGRVRWARAAQLAATTALTAQLPDIDALAGLFGSDDDEVVEEPSIDGFRDDFAELLNHDQMKKLSRVVVVVDDLDRCLSDTVIAVLEAIKLFLSVPKMAFLVAADEAAVKNAIAVRYGSAPGSANLAERYLDKIVQIPVRVPVLDRVDVEAYILQLLALGAQPDGSDEDGPDETDKALREHCDALRNESISTLADADQPPEGVEPEHLELTQRLAPLLHVGLDGNPCRVKRFLNEMSQREHLARSRGIDVDRAAVAKLMVLEQVHPNEFGRILRWVRSDELETSTGTTSSTLALTTGSTTSPTGTPATMKALIPKTRPMRTASTLLGAKNRTDHPCRPCLRLSWVASLEPFSPGRMAPAAGQARGCPVPQAREELVPDQPASPALPVAPAAEQ